MSNVSKAQLSVTDFSIALTIFTILIIAILITLNKYPLRINLEQSKNEMLINVFLVTDSLIKNPGSPSSWENNVNSLRVIGLADSNRILSVNKVNSFINLSYNTAKNFIGFYDFYFRILNYNNTAIVDFGLPFNGTSSISTRRHVIYNNENAIMELTLWE